MHYSAWSPYFLIVVTRQQTNLFDTTLKSEGTLKNKISISRGVLRKLPVFQITPTMNFFFLTIVVSFNDINDITDCQGNIILVFLLVVSCHYVLFKHHWCRDLLVLLIIYSISMNILLLPFILPSSHYCNIDYCKMFSLIESTPPVLIVLS